MYLIFIVFIILLQLIMLLVTAVRVSVVSYMEVCHLYREELSLHINKINYHFSSQILDNNFGICSVFGKVKAFTWSLTLILFILVIECARCYPAGEDIDHLFIPFTCKCGVCVGSLFGFQWCLVNFGISDSSLIFEKCVVVLGTKTSMLWCNDFTTLCWNNW